MRLIKALVAAVVLAALVVGPPWALLRYIGNPWPAEGVSLSAPITDGAIIGLLAVIVWGLWAQLMACIAVEAIAALTDDRIQLRVPFTLGVQQHLARRLITAIVVATVATPVATGAAMAAPGHSPSPAPAPTTPATSLTVVSSHHQQAEHQVDHDQAPAARVDTKKQQGRTTTVTVMRLDSLWSIAERHLGAGERLTEIGALNEGRTMNDGAVFHAADPIRPGWELLIPAGDETQESQVIEHDETVVRGDTLSEMALEELGDAKAYMKLFEASKDIVQPDGKRLTDPDLILPGWTIRIPGQAAPAEAETPSTVDDVEPPAVVETPQTPQEQAPDQVAPQEVAPPTVAESESAEEQAPQTADISTAVNQVADVDDEAGWPIRTIGGVCALLAGALVGLIALRRSRQRRLRKPGQQMPLPAAEAEVIETEVRAVADELSLDNVDVAMRALVASCDQAGIPRPVLRLARLTGGQLDLYFTDAATLPAPWEATSEPGVWVLSAEAAAELEDPDGVAAPWPALVTIGHDVENGIILLNLDETATFGVVGNDPHVHDTFAAIAFELGTAPWAADLSMTTVGSLAELGDVLEPGRLRYVPTVGGSSSGLLGELAAAASTDRVHVVLDSGRVITREQHDQLRSHGAVVVTNGWFAGETALDVTSIDQARLLPYQLDITPQLVDQRTYGGLLEVLQTSLTTPGEDVDADPGERVLPFDSDPPTAEPPGTVHDVVVDDVRDVPAAAFTGGGFQLLEELAADDEPADLSNDETTRQGDEPAAGVESAARLDEDMLVEAAAESTAPAGVTEWLLSVTADETTPEIAEDDAAVEFEESAGDVPPVELEETSAETELDHEPTAEEEEAGEAEEISEHAGQADVAAAEPVATRGELHPLLATGHPVIRLLGPVVDIVGAASSAPTSETHQKVCTRIAAYMALNPGASRPALTQAVWGGQRISASTVDSRISNLRAWLGEDRETGEKYLPPRSLRFSDVVTTDWDVFTRLIGSKPASAATTALEEALSLVRDRPLGGEESKHYGFAEYVVSDMMDTIVDAAYELARRRYFEGSWRKAGQTAALGVLLEPGNERLWRLRILAAHSAGNPEEVTEASDRMHARISELGFDLEDETTDLLQALKNHDVDAIEQARGAL